MQTLVIIDYSIESDKIGDWKEQGEEKAPQQRDNIIAQKSDLKQNNQESKQSSKIPKEIVEEKTEVKSLKKNFKEAPELIEKLEESEKRIRER